jgi:predicted DCC family thiol-disulfide oxidoreductase YuxK
MTEELRAACRDAVQVTTPDGRVLGGGAAVAFILGEIGYPRLRWIMTRPVLHILVEWGYRFVARHRRWIGRLIFGQSCQT